MNYIAEVDTYISDDELIDLHDSTEADAYLSTIEAHEIWY